MAAPFFFVVRTIQRAALVGLLGWMAFWAAPVFGEQRFPPPDFESGYKLRVTNTPEARALWWQYADAGILMACLGAALWIIYKRRSRRGVFWLSLFSLGYFGFYRKGCICAIGSVQNVALGLFDRSYPIPITVLIFFAAPIVAALFAGRVFCSAVCPHGALQDLMLLKPLKIPRWIEHGLSVIPFLFLGAGVIYAATATGFLICRYDPFVPIFRLSGGWVMLGLGGILLAAGTVIGRPYCRFLCPYGALLRVASLASKWRVRVTPDTCTQCRLCEQSCPYGAMREPSAGAMDAAALGMERRRLGWLLLLIPVWIGAGGWLGSGLSIPASQLHPTVALAERYVRQQKQPVQYGPQTAEALSLRRAAENPEALFKAAADLRGRFVLAGWLFGGWAGLVIGIKLITLSVRPARTDFEPDRGACVGCARCFEYCPSERVRRGELPSVMESMPLPAATGGTKA